MSQQVAPFEDYTKDDPYFTPEMMASLAVTEENFRRGETIWFSIEELDEIAETGIIPQRAIDFMEKHEQNSK